MNKMKLEEQIKEIINKMNNKMNNEEDKRDKLFLLNDALSNCEFFKSVGIIEAYTEIIILLTEALVNGK